MTDFDAFDIFSRIRRTRLERCGGEDWVLPPADWPDIVQVAWPRVWSKAPSRVPAGWCDLILAFSEHAVELADGRNFGFDAYEDPLTGKLSFTYFHGFSEQRVIMNEMIGYQHVSASICRCCGEPGEVRKHDVLPTRVLCDDHFDGAA